MIHYFNQEFYEICDEILSENKSIEEWVEIESDDLIQKENYEGGFDATTMTFSFSLFENNKEYWFEIPLELIGKIKNKEIIKIEVFEAEW